MWDPGSRDIDHADYRIWTIKGRPYHRIKKETKSLIVKLYRHDYKIQDLSRAFNSSTRTVWKILKNSDIQIQYSRRPTLVGSDNEVKYRLDPYETKIIEFQDKNEAWNTKAVKVRSKVKIQFNKSYTRACQLKIILEAFSSWLVYLIDHTFEGDWLDLACKGEKPP